MRWFVAGLLAVIAIDNALEADWSATIAFAALAVAQIGLASGLAERDTRVRVLTWLTLAVALGLYAAKWLG